VRRHPPRWLSAGGRAPVHVQLPVLHDGQLRHWHLLHRRMLPRLLLPVGRTGSERMAFLRSVPGDDDRAPSRRRRWSARRATVDPGIPRATARVPPGSSASVTRTFRGPSSRRDVRASRLVRQRAAIPPIRSAAGLVLGTTCAGRCDSTCPTPSASAWNRVRYAGSTRARPDARQVRPAVTTASPTPARAAERSDVT
jgi:hypothetical protein